MRVLLDTNVILDFLLDREPFAQAAADLWQANEDGDIDAYVSAMTPVNVFYIARKFRGSEEARRVVSGLLAACRIAPLDYQVLSQALALPFKDYEDAVQHASATGSQLEAVITRNPGDFQGATLPVYAPAEFLAQTPFATSDDEQPAA